MPSKITSAGDSKFRVINKQYNGGDCWINISKDLKPLFNYNKGDRFGIRIHKEDFIKAINTISILSYGELWECPSKELKRFYYSDEWFKTAFLQITDKFGKGDYAVYNAKFGSYSQDRSYIQNDDNILNVRDFLIEKHSKITVERLSDTLLDMRIETSIHDLSYFYIENQVDNKIYDVNELAAILKALYSSAPDREKVLSIHMFGLKYGEYIVNGDGISITQIIKLSGLPESYSVEINNGVNIYLAIKNKKYGVAFDNESPVKGATDFADIKQKIFYGAPGTGKSHIIKELTQGESVIRTTFHPDSDYSTFVGAYKPTTQEEVVMTVIGTKAVPVENGDGSPRKEKKIVYEFVNQAFLQAYINAWKMYADDEQNPRKQYLIIEEINRGNCAQIFGDLFQLLDRNDEGFSEYPIKSDSDMEMHLAKAFKGMSFLETPSIAGISGEDVARKIRNGEIMILPPNLYIWATMNTSDQSLFPIDSAFKRRWEWKYLPIEDAKKDWKIKVNGNEYDWYRFLEAINKEVLTLTHSEDKQLGYFFAKAKNNIIDAETLVNKVYFYLWNDVFKDYDFESMKAFKKIGSNEAIAFKDFVDGKIVNEPMAEQVLINLEISKKEETEETIE